MVGDGVSLAPVRISFLGAFGGGCCSSSEAGGVLLASTTSTGVAASSGTGVCNDFLGALTGGFTSASESASSDPFSTTAKTSSLLGIEMRDGTTFSGSDDSAGVAGSDSTGVLTESENLSTSSMRVTAYCPTFSRRSVLAGASGSAISCCSSLRDVGDSVNTSVSSGFVTTSCSPFLPSLVVDDESVKMSTLSGLVTTYCSIF